MFDYTDEVITASLARTEEFEGAPEDLIGEWVVAIGTESTDIFILPLAQAAILADSIRAQLEAAAEGRGPGPCGPTPGAGH